MLPIVTIFPVDESKYDEPEFADILLDDKLQPPTVPDVAVNTPPDVTSKRPPPIVIDAPEIEPPDTKAPVIDTFPVVASIEKLGVDPVPYPKRPWEFKITLG
jgi:hypothetical protein